MRKHFWKIIFSDGDSYMPWASTIKTAVALAVFARNKDHPQNNPVNSTDVKVAIHDKYKYLLQTGAC